MTTARDAAKAWRRFESRQDQTDTNMRIGITASLTAEPLVPYLGAALIENAFAQPKIDVASFGQIHQTCRAPQNAFGEAPDVIVVLWRLEDLAPTLEEAPLSNALDALLQSLAHLRTHFSGTIIVSTPPWPDTPSLDTRHIRQYAKGMPLYMQMTQNFLTRVQNINGIRIADVASLANTLGLERAYDNRKWFLYRQPWSETFWHMIGVQIARLIRAEKISAKKCIVLDADNTLWGGIIGEDGMDGVQLGDDFPGNCFKAFQQHLAHLRREGIMLAVASRNNEADFFEMFDGHDAMVLSRDDITVFEVHWQSKVESILRIAKTLNIGTDALVFIDDSMKEISEVRGRLPEVTSIQVPEEIADLPALLMGSDLFDILELTEEDAQRTEMIRANLAREADVPTLSEEEFKKTLNLHVSIFRVQKQHMARTVQLINKTNQFNVTTKRRAANEVQALADNPDCRLLALKLEDKYGDYGLTGVAILIKDGAICEIDTLLMSCRILGHKAETAFIHSLGKAAQDMGCDTLRGAFLPTRKNGLVKDLYADHGFKYSEQDQKWALPLNDAPELPAHLRLTLDL